MFCLIEVVVYILFFFFSSRRRHTRFSRDWSSDVCSSDLPGHGGDGTERVVADAAGRRRVRAAVEAHGGAGDGVRRRVDHLPLERAGAGVRAEVDLVMRGGPGE